jgi:hypothetical protein
MIPFDFPLELRKRYYNDGYLRNIVPCKTSTKRTKRHKSHREANLRTPAGKQCHGNPASPLIGLHLHTDAGDHGLSLGTGSTQYSGCRFLYRDASSGYPDESPEQEESPDAGMVPYPLQHHCLFTSYEQGLPDIPVQDFRLQGQTPDAFRSRDYHNRLHGYSPFCRADPRLLDRHKDAAHLCIPRWSRTRSYPPSVRGCLHAQGYRAPFPFSTIRVAGSIRPCDKADSRIAQYHFHHYSMAVVIFVLHLAGMWPQSVSVPLSVFALSSCLAMTVWFSEVRIETDCLLPENSRPAPPVPL